MNGLVVVGAMVAGSPAVLATPVRAVALPLFPRYTGGPTMVRSRTLEGITVLLVDDDPEELAVVGTLLRSEGADVTTVASLEDFKMASFQNAGAIDSRVATNRVPINTAAAPSARAATTC